jgi:hypothetical protein
MLVEETLGREANVKFLLAVTVLSAESVTVKVANHGHIGQESGVFFWKQQTRKTKEWPWTLKPE